MSDSKKTPVIKSNKMYDALKYIAQILLPAAGTLYFGLAQAWGLANSTEVVGTIVAIDTFLGVLLHISNTQYNNSDARYDGHINVDEEGTATMSLDSDAVASKDKIAIKIHKKA